MPGLVIENFDPEKHLRYMPSRFYLYEIHSSVFLFKAHASGAISSSRYAETTALIRRFIGLLTKIAVDDDHIASRYAKLLQSLWFRRAGPLGDTHNADGSNPHTTEESTMGQLPLLGMETSNGQGTTFDNIGLEPFENMDVSALDGFFAMPPVFPYDLSAF